MRISITQIKTSRKTSGGICLSLRTSFLVRASRKTKCSSHNTRSQNAHIHNPQSSFVCLYIMRVFGVHDPCASAAEERCVKGSDSAATFDPACIERRKNHNRLYTGVDRRTHILITREFSSTVDSPARADHEINTHFMDTPNKQSL
jgi:hypothetical protein